MGAIAAYLECTTLAALKTQLKGMKDTSNDDALEQLITATSMAIQNWLGTGLVLGQRTEEYDVVPRQPFLFLRNYPVTSISAVRVSADWDFNNATPLASTDYRVQASTGKLVFLDELLEPDVTGLHSDRQEMAAQVIYTAGFAATTDDLIANYTPIQTACHLWCAAIWKQREQPMALSERISDTSVARSGELKMPKSVEDLLWPYRRMSFGG